MTCLHECNLLNGQRAPCDRRNNEAKPCTRVTSTNTRRIVAPTSSVLLSSQRHVPHRAYEHELPLQQHAFVAEDTADHQAAGNGTCRLLIWSLRLSTTSARSSNEWRPVAICNLTTAEHKSCAALIYANLRIMRFLSIVTATCRHDTDFLPTAARLHTMTAKRVYPCIFRRKEQARCQSVA